MFKFNWSKKGVETEEGRAVYKEALSEFNGETPVVAQEPLEVVVVPECEEYSKAKDLLGKLLGSDTAAVASEAECVDLLRIAILSGGIKHPRLEDEIVEFLLALEEEPILVSFEHAPTYIEAETEVGAVQASVNALYDLLDEMGTIEGQEFITDPEPILVAFEHAPEWAEHTPDIYDDLDELWVEGEFEDYIQETAWTVKEETVIHAPQELMNEVNEDLVPCKKCGGYIGPEFRFCDHCGAATENARGLHVSPDRAKEIWERTHPSAGEEGPTITEKVAAVVEEVKAAKATPSILEGLYRDEKGYYHAPKGKSFYFAPPATMERVAPFLTKTVRAIKSYLKNGWDVGLQRITA